MSDGIITTTPEHEVAYHDIVGLVRKHADNLSALELLAVAANMVGKLMALQDQRTMTNQRILEIVKRNMEIGNRQVVEQLRDAPPAGNA